MACEVPVIATNVGGVPEVVTDGVDGYLIPPHDVETGAERALEILTRPDRGRSMGRKARTSARAKYCANDVIPMYEAYYRAVLQAAQPAANASAVNASAINATIINDR
jgi:glycosyltransferase involved in cell wall biosynthesis